MNNPSCPGCGKPLEKVRQSPNSLLNAEQFDAARAGDWFCTTCPGNNQARTGYRYFWDKDLSAPVAIAQPREQTASQQAAPEAPTAPDRAEFERLAEAAGVYTCDFYRWTAADVARNSTFGETTKEGEYRSDNLRACWKMWCVLAGASTGAAPEALDELRALIQGVRDAVKEHPGGWPATVPNLDGALEMIDSIAAVPEAPTLTRALREVRKQQADPKLATAGATAYERFLYAELARLQAAVIADSAPEAPASDDKSLSVHVQHLYNVNPFIPADDTTNGSTA